MTTIGKVLVIVTAAASLAFLGFAAVTLVGGPNWEAEATQLPDYIIERVEGEVPTWSVKTRRTGESVAQGLKSLSAAVVAARKDLKQKQETKLGQINGDIPKVEQDLKATKQAIEVDIQAMDRREAELVAELTTLNNRIEQLSEDGLAKSREAQAVRIEVEKRREEVFRLRNLLSALQTDHFRSDDQARKLHELLTRLQGDIDRLERRYEQLKQQLGT